jgi:hypothetical protein
MVSDLTLPPALMFAVQIFLRCVARFGRSSKMAHPFLIEGIERESIQAKSAGLGGWQAGRHSNRIS